MRGSQNCWMWLAIRGTARDSLAYPWLLTSSKRGSRRSQRSGLPPSSPPARFWSLKVMERRVELFRDPEWTVFQPPRLEGERSPDNRVGSDRLQRLDAALARSTRRFLGGGPADWPVLTTLLLPKKFDADVAVDRNDPIAVTVKATDPCLACRRSAAAAK